ncbi:glycosyltransferase family 4 protein [Candidatus Sumerlaeota bacterium]|nr:glycosyltransferase family 4 protein [Candidatus Sumerlaeota bacterium]
MKIGIDASCLLTRRTGIGYFTQNLLQEMLLLNSPHKFNIFMNSLRHPVPLLPILDKNNVRIRHYRIPGPLLVNAWRYLRFPPIELFTGFVDVFHSTTGYLPPQIRGKRVATVYDLFFIRHPELCDKLGGKYFAGIFPKTLPHYDHIIVPSNATKHDLLNLIDVSEEKISVIYGGVDQQKFHVISDQSLLETVREEYCLPRNYIMSVSTIEPRKNIEGLLIAYRHLKEILYNPPKLVIVGQEGWDSRRIKGLARQHNLGQDVIFTGYVPEEHLPLLYNAALLFVYPSLWEGFGLPVLEAMACGAPCLVSTTPALLEITGDAAATTDPYNYYEIAERIKDLITSHRERDEFLQRGLLRVHKFSWALTAQKTLRVYEKLFAGK